MKDRMKKKAICLINELRSGQADDDRLKAIVSKLDEILPDPNYWDYTIDSVPELTAEKIVEKAFSYKPFLL